MVAVLRAVGLDHCLRDGIGEVDGEHDGTTAVGTTSSSSAASSSSSSSSSASSALSSSSSASSSSSVSLASKSVSASLRTLSGVADRLQLRDINISTYMAALSILQDERRSLTERLHSQSQSVSSLVEQTRTSLAKLAQIRQTSARFDAEWQHRSMVARENGVAHATNVQKRKQYTDQREHHKRSLMKLGLDGNVVHSALQAQAARLQSARHKLQEHTTALTAFHQLPPDVGMARLRLAELRAELERLRTRFATALHHQFRDPDLQNSQQGT